MVATSVERPQRERRPPVRRWLVPLAIAVVPLLAAVVRVWATRYDSASDVAAIELRIRDLGRDPALVGPYSRFGYAHPGPAMFYLLWFPYRLLGQDGCALATGMLAGNALLIALVVHGFAATRRPRSAWWAAIGSLYITGSVGLAPIALPWNPFVGTIAGGALVALAWISVDDERLACLAVPPIAAVVAQSHLGALPFSLLALLWWLGAWVLSHLERDRSERRKVRTGDRWRLGGAAIACVLWLPPLIDQFGTGGNLSSIWRLSRESTEPLFGMDAAAAAVSDTYSLRPWWLNVSDPWALTSTRWTVPVVLVAVVACLLLAAIRVGPGAPRRRVLFASGMVISLVACQVASIAEIRGAPWPYLIAWDPSAAIAVTLLAFAVAGHGLTDGTMLWKSRRWTAATGIAAVVMAIIGAVGSSVGVAQQRLPAAGLTTAAALRPALREWLARSPDPVRMESDTSFPSMELVTNLALMADRDGFSLNLQDRYRNMVIPARLRPARVTLNVSTDELAEHVYAEGTAEVVAFTNPFSPAEMATLRALWKRRAALNADDAIGVASVNGAIDNLSAGRHIGLVVKATE